MDKPISPFLAYGIVFGAMLIVLAVVYIRRIRYERYLERERKAIE